MYEKNILCALVFGENISQYELLWYYGIDGWKGRVKKWKKRE